MPKPQDSVNTLPDDIAREVKEIVIREGDDISLDTALQFSQKAYERGRSDERAKMAELPDDMKDEFFLLAITHVNGGGFIATGKDGQNYRDTEAMWEWIESRMNAYTAKKLYEARREQIEKDAEISGVIEDALFGEDNSGTISRKIRSQLTTATPESKQPLQ